MIAIAVDDEALMLGALVHAIQASSDISAVSPFSGCEDALDYVKHNPVDVAFLDINMRGMGGLVLAEKILSRHTLLTELLVHLGVSRETAAADACKMEHVISDETFEAIKIHMLKYGE